MIQIHFDVFYDILCQVHNHQNIIDSNKARLILPVIQSRRSDILKGLFHAGPNRYLSIKFCRMRQSLLSLLQCPELLEALFYTNHTPTIIAFNKNVQVEQTMQNILIRRDAVHSIRHIQRHSYWRLSDSQLQLAEDVKALDVLLAVENNSIYIYKENRKTSIWKRIY